MALNGLPPAKRGAPLVLSRGEIAGGTDIAR